MLETVRHLLEQSPMLALFAVIGLGYALGQISLGGFSLGIGAVLFAGLAVGALAPAAAPPGLVSSIGLVMFLYGIGIQYGRQFFAGLSGPGLKWNLIAGAGVLAALAAALLLGRAAGVSTAYSMGLFAGALTSTPTLQAAIDAAGNRDPAIGYSVAYPFGVIGPILCLFVFPKLFKPRLMPAPATLQHLELTLDKPPGTTVADLMAMLPTGVDIVAIRQGRTNKLPDPESPLAAGDAVLLLGQPDALEKARAALGRVDPGRITEDRGDLDLVRAYVSRPSAAGTPLERIRFPEGVVAKIAEVRRGDALLFPAPGLGFFSLGLAGGPLLAALVLGRLGRVGSLSWHMPLSANLTLRNFGLTLFLAAVGLGSGAPFLETVSKTGFTFLAIALAIVLAAILGVLLLGQGPGKMATDDLFGVASGAAGNPAIGVYANRALPSDRIDVAYATIFPSMTILKILCVQIAIGFLGGR